MTARFDSAHESVVRTPVLAVNAPVTPLPAVIVDRHPRHHLRLLVMLEEPSLGTRRSPREVCLHTSRPYETDSSSDSNNTWPVLCQNLHTPRAFPTA
jgi:hypothetical protein